MSAQESADSSRSQVLEISDERGETGPKGLLGMLNLGTEEEPVVHVYSVVGSERDKVKKGRHTFVIKAVS